MSNKKEFRLAEQWKKLLLIPILVFVVGLGCMLGFGLTGNGALNLASDLNGGTVIDVTVGTAMTEENRDDVVGIATDLLDELGFAVTEDIRAAGEIGTEAAGFTIIGRVTAGEGQTRDEAVEAFNSGLIGSVDEGTGLRNQIYNYLTEHASEGQTVNRMNITVHSYQAEGSLPWQQVLFFGLTVLIAALVAGIYLWIRFEFLTGLFVFLDLLIDLILTVCLTAVFRVQVSAWSLGALAAAAACSFLGTVVIFDRIRENSRRLRLQELSPSALVNVSAAQTAPRTLLSAVVLAVMAAVAGILSGSAVLSFMLVVIIGIAVSVFTSLCLTPSLWARAQERRRNRNKEQKLFHEFKRKEKPAQETAAE